MMNYTSPYDFFVARMHVFGHERLFKSVDEMHVLTFLFDFVRGDQTYTHTSWLLLRMCACMFEANFHHRQMVFKHTYMLESLLDDKCV